MSNISFIRRYSGFAGTETEYIDIAYKSGRVVTVALANAPHTAILFMHAANERRQFDKVYKREEAIYEL